MEHKDKQDKQDKPKVDKESLNQSIKDKKKALKTNEIIKKDNENRNR